MGSFKIDLNDYNKDQRLILLTIVAMYLPFYLSFFVLFLDMVYIFKNKKYSQIQMSMDKAKLIRVFFIYTFLISLFAKNFTGLLKSLEIFAILSFMLFVRENISKNLLKDIINLIMIFSSICFIIAISEYLIVFVRLRDIGAFIDFMRLNRRELGFMFLNVNYLAMACSITALVSAYRYLISEKKEKWLSFFVGLLSVICLLITESAASLGASFIGILLLTILLKRYRYTLLMLFLLLGGLLIFYFQKSAFELGLEEGLFSDMGLRWSIWISSWEAFKNNILIGKGPDGLSTVYSLIRGRKIFHSHSIYLNFLVSYGIIGLGLISPLIYEIFFEIKGQADKKNSKLIICLIVMVLLAGIFDTTIVWVQTGLIFLSLVGGFAACYKSDEKYKLTLKSRNDI